MPVVTSLPVQPDNQTEKPVLLDADKVIKFVTLFGDSAIEEDHPVYKDIFNLCKVLAEKSYGIVNGGGPGVMHAATSGAESVNGHTVAIYWEPKLASHFEGKTFTNIADESSSYSNYMMRTLGLIEKGQVFIVCQGGTGTISEFGMVWALAKMYFGRHKPVILYGDFWHDVVDAFSDNMLIDDEERGVLYFAETPEEVCNLLEKFEAEIQTRKRELFEGDELAFLVGATLTTQTYNKVAKLYHKERTGSLVAEAQLLDFMNLVPAGEVLDIGTGPGYDLGFLSQKYQMTGVELSKEFYDIARIENPEAKMIHDDIVKCELPAKTYQGVWSRDAIHHISGENLDVVFQKISNSLVDNGIFYLIVQEGQGEDVKIERRATYEMKRFYHYFDEAEITDRANKAGMEIVKFEHQTRSHKWIAAVLRKRVNG